MAISENDAAKQAGVRRLNKKPLAIVLIAFVIIVGILTHSILQRGKDQKATAKPDQNTPAPATDSKSSYMHLVESAPVGMVPDTTVAPSETEDTEVENATTAATTNNQAQSGNKTQGTVKTTSISIVPERQAHSKSKEEPDEAEERKRRVAMKRQLYEQALNAPTSVNIARLDNQKDTQSGQPSLADILKGTTGGANPSDAIGSRLSALASLAGGAAGDANNQKSKLEFSEKETAGKFGYLAASRVAPVSPFELKAGTVIPAILITKVNSDLPGMLIGQVSQNVYDTATGKHLLIPQGTKIVGDYDSMVSYGQSRALVAWNKLTFPDASILSLGSMSGADQSGAAGFKDQTNNHYVKLFTSAIMLSLFAAGVQLSQPSSNSAYPTARETVAAEIGRELGQLGQEIIRKQMNVQPTIEIRPGYRFNIMVNKDLVLTPYAPMQPRITSNP